MGIKSADASLFQTAVLSAAKNLEAKKEWINELNDHDNIVLLVQS